ncbi:MAG: transketolase C-terminal domain-containing protein [Hydrogenophaga sp.]|nr:transketolase C-terminal domain-containing protein [Hydrogenophaga sp.]
MSGTRKNYGTAMLSAFEYLLENYPEVFVIGQGLWSPWYVGNSMTDLDKKFGAHRVIDTPVSESACTGAAVGAALAGMKPIVVHPRMDFMLYAMDAVVNQAAKWSHMVGGQAGPGVTIRTIINRGGEQGAQHSQALHAWFAHVPGLRVVMPATVADARDLLIASALCPDPVIFIDDRWLYDLEDDLPPVVERSLALERPQCLKQGHDITLVASGYSTRLALDAAALLEQQGVSAEVVDLRILNPFVPDNVVASVTKTGRMLVVDGGWSPCGMAGEVIASVAERVAPSVWKKAPGRITLPFAPAPTSRVLEKAYYPTAEMVVAHAGKLMDKAS